MRSTTPRRIPALLVLATTLSGGPLLAQGLGPGEVQDVFALPAGNNPEGVAVAPDGDLYVTNRYYQGGLRFGELLKVDAAGNTRLVTTFEGTPVQATGLLGLAVDRDGNVFAALDNRIPTSHGVWKVSANGKKVGRLPGSDQIPFPNGLTFDQAGNLYVSDSALGQIWRLPADGSSDIALWAQDAALAPYPFDPFGFPMPGANGIAYCAPNLLYVANTEQGTICRVTIANDGSAGAVDVIAAGYLLLTVDGIAVDAQGDIHGVIPGYAVLGTAPLVRVDPGSGQVTPTVTDPAAIALFDVPLSLAFGARAGDRKSVYVTNGDLPIVPGGPGPGLIQVGVGVPGYAGN